MAGIDSSDKAQSSKIRVGTPPDLYSCGVVDDSSPHRSLVHRGNPYEASERQLRLVLSVDNASSTIFDSHTLVTSCMVRGYTGRSWDFSIGFKEESQTLGAHRL